MKVTESALHQFREILDKNDQPNSGIRVNVVPGCCSPKIELNIQEHPAEGDVVVVFGDVDFYLEQHAVPVLDQIRINFGDNGLYFEEFQLESE